VTDKKDREHQILNMVYDPEERMKAIASEGPDFIVDCLPAAIFGVEITEFYFTDSEARLRNIPGYFTQIMDKGEYKHKNDKKELKVDEVLYTSSKDNSSKTIRAIMHPVPPIDEYTNGICDAIETKNIKAVHYNAELDFIDLVIYDTYGYLSIHPHKDGLYKSLFNDRVNKLIRETLFREIYLISKNSDLELIHVPLKGMFFFAETRWLMYYVAKYHEDLLEMSENDFVKMCYEYFRFLGFPGVYCTESEGVVELHFYQWGFQMTQKGVSIKDHRMFPIEQRHIETKLSLKHDIFNEQFRDAMQDYRRNNQLQLYFAFKVNQPENPDKLQNL
jgi:hypothetical protein